MKYFLWNRIDPHGNRWGRVSPRDLVFTSKAEGETVAKRYRKAFPKQDFIVADEKGPESVRRNPRRKTKRARPGRRVTAPRKTYRSAKKHTRKATTRRLQDQWQHVYETARKEKFSEGDAIRIANGVTKRNVKRLKQNPLKRAPKRLTSFGRRKSEHAIEAIRVGPGKRVTFFYYTGTALSSLKAKAKRYPSTRTAHDEAKKLRNQMPEGIKGLRVVKL